MRYPRQMGYPGYAFSLLTGGWGQQCAGRREQDIFKPARLYLRQKMPAEHACRTSAARAARVDVLLGGIYHAAAIEVPVSYIYAVP